MPDSDDSADRYRTPTESIMVEAGDFLGSFRTLFMATVSADGVPDASYAPFVRVDDNAFYVNLSALSRHTGNLLATPLASVLFLQAEDHSKQLFARKRLGFDAAAELVARDSARWCPVMDLFTVSGDVGSLLAALEARAAQQLAACSQRL